MVFVGPLGAVAVNLSDTAIATVVAALIAGIVGWLTARASRQSNIAVADLSSKASVETQMTHSRSDIEQEAFRRAQMFYTDTIDRQQREIQELENDATSYKARIKTLEDTERDTRQKLTVIERRMMRIEEENANLQKQLGVAKKLLERKFPDE